LQASSFFIAFGYEIDRQFLPIFEKHERFGPVIQKHECAADRLAGQQIACFILLKGSRTSAGSSKFSTRAFRRFSIRSDVFMSVPVWMLSSEASQYQPGISKIIVSVR
jgi:hypothetical protein